MENDPQINLTDGSPVTPEHLEIDPRTGMQKGYVVLSDAERAKGFVRPVRRSYIHVGPTGPANPLRDLTQEEVERHQKRVERNPELRYVKYEKYPGEGPVVGRFWTQAQLDKVDQGCGEITTMDRTLAETYARDPSFYGGTFCTTCGNHFGVGPQGEFIWADSDERVGT